MNKTILMGRLTKDPDLKNSTTTVATFTLAVNRRFKREGEPDADFINCVCFGKSADALVQNVKKGRQISVVGRLQVRSYDDKQGNRKWVTNVVVEEWYFAESKRDNQPSPSPVPTPNTPDAKDGFVPVDPSFEDDLPF